MRLTDLTPTVESEIVPLVEAQRIRTEMGVLVANPSRSDLIGFAQKARHGDLRGVLTRDGAVVWDAFELIHEAGARQAEQAGLHVEKLSDACLAQFHVRTWRAWSAWFGDQAEARLQPKPNEWPWAHRIGPIVVSAYSPARDLFDGSEWWQTLIRNAEKTPEGFGRIEDDAPAQDAPMGIMGEALTEAADWTSWGGWYQPEGDRVIMLGPRTTHVDTLMRNASEMGLDGNLVTALKAARAAGWCRFGIRTDRHDVPEGFVQGNDLRDVRRCVGWMIEQRPAISGITAEWTTPRRDWTRLDPNTYHGFIRRGIVPKRLGETENPPGIPDGLLVEARTRQVETNYGTTVRLYVNPTGRELIALVQRSKQNRLRGLVVSPTEMIFWDGYDGGHDDIEQALGADSHLGRLDLISTDALNYTLWGPPSEMVSRLYLTPHIHRPGPVRTVEDESQYTPPEVLYHGTSEPPEVFTRKGLQPSMGRHGRTFLTDNPELALQYAGSDSERTGSKSLTVFAVKLSDLNPAWLRADPDHHSGDDEDWVGSLRDTDQCTYVGVIPPWMLRRVKLQGVSEAVTPKFDDQTQILIGNELAVFLAGGTLTESVEPLTLTSFNGESRTVPVLIDPTPTELLGFLNRTSHGIARALYVRRPQYRQYVWDGYLGSHDDINRALSSDWGEGFGPHQRPLLLEYSKVDPSTDRIGMLNGEFTKLGPIWVTRAPPFLRSEFARALSQGQIPGVRPSATDPLTEADGDMFRRWITTWTPPGKPIEDFPDQHHDEAVQSLGMKSSFEAWNAGWIRGGYFEGETNASIYVAYDRNATRRDVRRTIAHLIRLFKREYGMRPDSVQTPWGETLLRNLDQLLARLPEGPALKEAEQTITVAHVTPTRNVPGILRNGLQPRVGPRSRDADEQIPAVYVFVDQSSLETALSNWLGEAFEDEPLSLLLLDVPPEWLTRTGEDAGAAYEGVLHVGVPADRIRLAQVDLDTWTGGPIPGWSVRLGEAREQIDVPGGSTTVLTDPGLSEFLGFLNRAPEMYVRGGLFTDHRAETVHVVLWPGYDCSHAGMAGALMDEWGWGMAEQIEAERNLSPARRAQGWARYGDIFMKHGPKFAQTPLGRALQTYQSVSESSVLIPKKFWWSAEGGIVLVSDPSHEPSMDQHHTHALLYDPERFGLDPGDLRDWTESGRDIQDGDWLAQAIEHGWVRGDHIGEELNLEAVDLRRAAECARFCAAHTQVGVLYLDVDRVHTKLRGPGLEWFLKHGTISQRFLREAEIPEAFRGAFNATGFRKEPSYTELHQNPSRAEFLKLLTGSAHQCLRGHLLEDRTLVVWDADLATHGDVGENDKDIEYTNVGVWLLLYPTHIELNDINLHRDGQQDDSYLNEKLQLVLTNPNVLRLYGKSPTVIGLDHERGSRELLAGKPLTEALRGGKLNEIFSSSPGPESFWWEGGWIDPQGDLHEIDHARDIHHTDLVWPRFGELAGDEGTEQAMTLAFRAGWIRYIHDHEQFGFDWETPAKPALLRLLSMVRHGRWQRWLGNQRVWTKRALIKTIDDLLHPDPKRPVVSESYDVRAWVTPEGEIRDVLDSHEENAAEEFGLGNSEDLLDDEERPNLTTAEQAGWVRVAVDGGVFTLSSLAHTSPVQRRALARLVGRSRATSFWVDDQPDPWDRTTLIGKLNEVELGDLSESWTTLKFFWRPSEGFREWDGRESGANDVHHTDYAERHLGAVGTDQKLARDAALEHGWVRGVFEQTRFRPDGDLCLSGQTLDQVRACARAAVPRYRPGRVYVYATDSDYHGNLTGSRIGQFLRGESPTIAEARYTRPGPDLFAMGPLLDQVRDQLREWLIGAIGAEPGYSPLAVQTVGDLQRKYQIPPTQDAMEEFLLGHPLDQLFTREQIHRMVQSSINVVDWTGPTTNSLIEPKRRRTGWVVHFTDHPEQVQSGGFRHGADPDQIGISRTPTDRRAGILPGRPGWNFGYPVRSGRDLTRISTVGMYGLDRKGYGAHLVLFRTRYSLVHHHGDHEDQALFYGPDIDPGSIFIVRSDDQGWYDPDGAYYTSAGQAVAALIRMVEQTTPTGDESLNEALLTDEKFWQDLIDRHPDLQQVVADHKAAHPGWNLSEVLAELPEYAVQIKHTLGSGPWRVYRGQDTDQIDDRHQAHWTLDPDTAGEYSYGGPVRSGLVRADQVDWPATVLRGFFWWDHEHEISLRPGEVPDGIRSETITEAGNHEPTRFLYHVTSLAAARDIAQDGWLRPGTDTNANFDHYSGHSRGKLFFAATRFAIAEWWRTIKRQQGSIWGGIPVEDDPVGYGVPDGVQPDDLQTPVMLRIAQRRTRTDLEGGAGAVYVRGPIPLEQVELFSEMNQRWVPLNASTLRTVESNPGSDTHRPPEEAVEGLGDPAQAPT